MARAEYVEKPQVVGYRAVAYAVVAQGLEDAVKGDPGARAWLGSRAFEYWCDWCDLRPDWVLREVRPLLSQPREKRAAVGGKARVKTKKRGFAPEDIQWAVEEHDKGRRWKDVAMALGTNEEILRRALRRAGYGGEKHLGRVKRRFTEEEMAKAQELYVRHGNWNDVAVALETTRKTLVRALRDAGCDVGPGDRSRFNAGMRGG